MQRSSTIEPAGRRLPNGGIDYDYYRAAVEAERILALRRAWAAIQRGLRMALAALPHCGMSWPHGSAKNS